jgi:hypothetical protein
MANGSHHMFAFRIGAADNPNLSDGGKGALGDCPNGGNEFHPYVHDAQIPVRTITYPAGVGRSLKGSETLRMMVHFLNTTNDSIEPSVSVTLDYVDASKIDVLAAEYFLDAVGIKVPPGKSTQAYSFAMPSTVKLLSAVSHMHRHATHFEATLALADGASTMLYSTDQWAEPQPLDFAQPKPVEAGDVVHFACSYVNDTGDTLKFGESALTNEMCIFQGTFFPAEDGNGIAPLLFTADQ